MSRGRMRKSDAGLDAFTRELETHHIRGQWQYEPLLERSIGGPKPAGIPHLWDWETVHAKLLEACEVMPESYTARRNFSFINPGLEKDGTTHTLLAGIQIVKPGEIAWAHRHTIGAIRFVIEGSDKLYTVVNGEPLPMEPGDLVLTPNWNWHDHHNDSDSHGIWLDALDVPLIMGLNQPCYEPYGESTQLLRSRECDYWSNRGRLVRPMWESPATRNFPFRYPWAEIGPRLEQMADLDGTAYDGVVLEYVNPVTGASVLPTLGCWIQRLRPGFTGQRHRHSSSAIYFVMEGEGTTQVEDQELRWGPRDVFAVPNWAWHRHVNRSSRQPAILFSVNDIPLLDVLGLYREEPECTLHANLQPAVPKKGETPR